MCRTGGVAVLSFKERCRIEGELLCDADLLADSEEAVHRVVNLNLQKVHQIADRKGVLCVDHRKLRFEFLQIRTCLMLQLQGATEGDDLFVLAGEQHRVDVGTADSYIRACKPECGFQCVIGDTVCFQCFLVGFDQGVLTDFPHCRSNGVIVGCTCELTAGIGRIQVVCHCFEKLRHLQNGILRAVSAVYR